MTKIGFLGVGNMGGSLLKGWSQDPSLHISVYDVDQEKMLALSKQVRVELKESALALAQETDYIILAVKPAQVKEVLQEICSKMGGSQCLISIAAGIRCKELKTWSKDNCPVIRVMPNTPALVGAGVFAVCLDDERLNTSQKQFIKDLFSNLGQVHVLSETYFDAFTALVGSGPAYVFYFLESLIEAGVTLGFPRDKSTEMVLGLVDGCIKMLQRKDYSVSQLREMVASPAGTTIQGLNQLDRKAVKSAIIDAVDSAYRRSKELGD